MAAPQQRRFPLPRSTLGAVSETPATTTNTGAPTAGEATSPAEAAEAAANDPSAPTRGREMRTNLLSKLRPPPLVHAWEFWHEKPDPAAATPTPVTAGPFPPQLDPNRAPPQNYEPILTHLLSIADIKTFWSLFNNFEFSLLPQRNSVHLFHTTIRPVWEDPRNVRGGAWTFRVPKAAAVDFWQNICLLAIGEQLQAAVASDRQTFKDDICGVSYRPRFTSVLVTVWNRDGAHDEGVKRIAETVVSNMPDHLKPKEGSYYYKKHSDHAGFDQEVAKKNAQADTSRLPTAPPNTAALGDAQAKHEQVSDSVDDVAREVERVKKILEKVELDESAMASKLTEAEAAQSGGK